MASLKGLMPGALASACIIPLLLAGCGSSADAPATGTSASNGSGSGSSGGGGTVASSGGSGGSTSTSTGTGTSTMASLTGGLGNTAGGVLAAAGQTVAATGQSLQANALNNPAGISVLNSAAPGTGTGNVLDANVLSDTAPSPAPIQANVLANGQVVSASVANPTTTNIPAVTPVVDGASNIVAAVPGAAPLASTISTAAQGGLSTGGLTAPVSGASAPVAGAASAVTSAAAPLNSALNVQVGSDTLAGSPAAPATINADVATPSTLANANVSGNGLLGNTPVKSTLSSLKNVLSK